MESSGGRVTKFAERRYLHAKFKRAERLPGLSSFLRKPQALAIGVPKVQRRFCHVPPSGGCPLGKWTTGGGCHTLPFSVLARTTQNDNENPC